MDLTAKAQTLLALHIPGLPVVVPTVWDAWSAELVAGAGFAALTIGSHPAATAIGRADGEDLTLDEMLERVAVVAKAVEIPVSADLESGYAAEPERIIEGLLTAGAVGLNLEDTVHSEGGRLRSDREHADFIAKVRAAADATGVHVVINARTDLLHRRIGPAEDRVDRAIVRLTAAAESGADVLYPVGMHDDDIQRRLTTELPLPVNALATPEPQRYAALAASGVGRVSFGPFLQQALGFSGNQLLSGWLPR
ncbi:MAG: isocitrate lyase/phosphoenolpyruvate mutase family protein [Nocardioidaceae bacterium]